MHRLLLLLPLLALVACAASGPRAALYIDGAPARGVLLNPVPPVCRGCPDETDVFPGELTIHIQGLALDSVGVLHVHGRTHEARTGVPAAGMLIQVYGAAPDVRAVSGADGAFAIRIPRQPSAILAFRRNGMRTLNVSVDHLYVRALRSYLVRKSPR